MLFEINKKHHGHISHSETLWQLYQVAVVLLRRTQGVDYYVAFTADGNSVSIYCVKNAEQKRKSLITIQSSS